MLLCADNVMSVESFYHPLDKVSAFVLYSCFVALSYYLLILMSSSFVVTLNIGRDLTGTYFLPHGKALRLLAAVGVVCNLSVSCPLVTLPLRDAVLRLMCPSLDAADSGSSSRSNSPKLTQQQSQHDEQQHNCNGNSNGSDKSMSNGHAHRDAQHSSSNSSVATVSRGGISRTCGPSLSKHWLQVLAAFAVTVSASTLAICLQHHFAAACSLVGAVASFTDSIILPLVFYHRLHPVCTYRLWTLHAVMLLISFVTFGGGLVGNFCAQFPTVC